MAKDHILNIPRRSCLDLHTPAELAITQALEEVERAGCDDRLTQAVIKLSEARDLVSDYIDDRLKGKF